jgi:hypothetical protein
MKSEVLIKICIIYLKINKDNHFAEWITVLIFICATNKHINFLILVCAFLGCNANYYMTIWASMEIIIQIHIVICIAAQIVMKQ